MRTGLTGGSAFYSFNMTEPDLVNWAEFAVDYDNGFRLMFLKDSRRLIQRRLFLKGICFKFSSEVKNIDNSVSDRLIRGWNGVGFNVTLQIV
jgi:hypothetical protein